MDRLGAMGEQSPDRIDIAAHFLPAGFASRKTRVARRRTGPRPPHARYRHGRDLLRAAERDWPYLKLCAGSPGNRQEGDSALLRADGKLGAGAAATPTLAPSQ